MQSYSFNNRFFGTPLEHRRLKIAPVAATCHGQRCKAVKLTRLEKTPQNARYLALRRTAL